MNIFKQPAYSFHASELVAMGVVPPSWINQYISIPIEWIEAPLKQKARGCKEIRAKIVKILSEGREALLQFDKGFIQGHSGDAEDGTDTRWFTMVENFNGMLDSSSIKKIREKWLKGRNKR